MLPQKNNCYYGPLSCTFIRFYVTIIRNSKKIHPLIFFQLQEKNFQVDRITFSIIKFLKRFNIGGTTYFKLTLFGDLPWYDLDHRQKVINYKS